MVEYLRKSERSTGALDDLPPTLHEVIGQKIEKLSDDAKAAYQAASVLGSEFEFDVLLNVLQSNEGFLLDIIDEGIRSNIIAEVQGYSGDRYSFVQNIICKALYSGIPAKIRAEIHLNCGTAIEKYDLEGIEERYGELAHHFEQGGNKRKTFDYTLKAARRACELYAHDEALSFYVKAIKLAQSSRSGIDEEELIEIHEERGLVYQQKNDYRRAQRDFEKVIDLCNTTGRNDRRGYALKNLSNISIYKREFKEAYEYSLRTIRHAMEVGDSGLKAESLAAFGNIYLFSGDYDRALTYYNKALEMDRRDPDKLRASKVYTNLGVIYWYKEKNEKALAYYQQALRLLRELGNKTFQPLCVNNIAMITLQQGHFTKALTMCKDSLEISRETGNSLIEVYIYNNISEIYQRLGDYNSALMWSRKAISLIKQIKDQGSKADFIRNRGVVYFLLGQNKKAKNDLKKALVLSKSSGKKEYEMNALYWLIRLLVDEGDIEDAKHYLVEFRDTIAHRKSCEYSLKLAMSSSMIELAEGRNESALWSLTRTACADGEMDPMLFMLYLYQKAEALRRIGKKEEGKEEIEKAWEIVASISRKIKDRPLKEIFLASPGVLAIKDLLEELSSSLRD
jgi:tetratricopeptide (TPR) repeat protein